MYEIVASAPNVFPCRPFSSHFREDRLNFVRCCFSSHSHGGMTWMRALYSVSICCLATQTHWIISRKKVRLRRVRTCRLSHEFLFVHLLCREHAHRKERGLSPRSDANAGLQHSISLLVKLENHWLTDVFTYAHESSIAYASVAVASNNSEDTFDGIKLDGICWGNEQSDASRGCLLFDR